MLAGEAAVLFYPKYVYPLAIKLYSLPLSTIEYVSGIFEIVLGVARVGTDATQLMFQRLMRYYSALFY